VNKSLLVIDDEKLVRWTIQQIMGKENFRVVSASDGDEAMELIKQNRFDVIITDLVMPGRDGIDVAKWIKKLHPETKVIMITAYGYSLDKDEARKAGISFFLDKPFQVDEVKRAVSQVLLPEA
jgi:DNA-binding NtrC family response regulator